jgi:hypothetical protein
VVAKGVSPPSLDPLAPYLPLQYQERGLPGRAFVFHVQPCQLQPHLFDFAQSTAKMDTAETTSDDCKLSKFRAIS